jgi:DNA polymerase III subunit beta
MKLALHRADLVKALDFVARTVERRSTIPILSNVRLEASAGALCLAATDLDAEATSIVAAEVEAPGALTVSAARLHDIARKLDDKANVALAADKDALTLKSGRARFTLQTLPVADWPDLNPGDLPHGFELPAADLARALQKCAFAISNEETRYYLNGVFLHTVDVEGEKKLRFVSTDGHRLARFEREAPAGSESIPGVIIPRKAVNEIVKLASADKTATARIALSNSKIRIEIGSSKLLSKLIDGSFPDYARVIPTSNDKKAELDREAFASAVDRVSTIASERGRAIKLEFKPDALTLSVTNAETGSASEEQEIDYAAAPVEIGFNAAYLREILGNFEGDRVEVAMNDSGSPTILTSPHNPGLLAVLMPMRV